VSLRSDAPRIFIAEDDPSIVELLTSRLETAGYETRAARNGWRALEGIQAMSPDAVILDINMPGMDGFAVLRAMRQARHLASTPVLMLTARGGREDVAQAISLGAKDYLTKPFDAQDLLARVGRLVRKRAAAKAAAAATGAGEADDDALLI
jgi:DNA-binding response OmpR family regulator